MDSSILALSVACVVLIRAGQILFHAGVSRSKNAASAIARSLCDLAVTTLAFWGIGAAILLQDHNGFAWLDYRLLFGENVAVLVYLPLVLIATGQVGNAVSERSRFVVVAPVSLLLAILVIPLAGHWSWIGFLKDRRGIDVAGAMPLHIVSAVVALVAAKAVGPRSGKYNRDGSCNAIPGHSITLVGAGTLVMLAGWLAYLALASWMWMDVAMWRSMLGGIVAAAAGTCAAMVFSRLRFGKVDVLLAMLGLLSGIAGISAGAGLLPAWGAAVLGAIAGVAGPWFAIWVDLRLRIDDASGLATSLGAAAFVSLVGSPLLIGATFAHRAQSLVINLAGVPMGVIVAGALTWALFALLKRLTKIRASEADEYDGLDLAEHDINAYPDFQQTMIKSHHLRQA